VLSPASLCGPVDQGRPDGQVDGNVLSRLDPLAEVPLPRAEGVHPRPDGEAVPAQLGDGEGAPPSFPNSSIGVSVQDLAPSRRDRRTAVS
jgi:hypothetical protein